MNKHFTEFNSDKLNPIDFMGLRGKKWYNPDLFFNHKVYDNIRDSIKNKPLTLIIGNPLSGKTRIVYDTLKELKNTKILKANIEITRLENYKFDNDADKTYFVFDDFDEFFGNEIKNAKTNELLLEIIKKDYKCIITCRTGPEFNKIKRNIDKHLLNELFDSNYYWIPRFSRGYVPLNNFLLENKHKFKNNLNEFDGNLGSLLLPLSDMRRRFESLQINEERIPLAILLGLKLHYHFYNYENTKREYAIDKIKFFCEKYLNEKIEQYEWDDATKKLMETKTDLNFIEISDRIIIEEVYLDIFKDKDDVVFNEFNKKRLRTLLKEKYDIYTKKAYGFPLTTSDYNNKILKANSFEEGLQIFKEIKKPDAYSYISLMKLTDDTNKLYDIYEQMRSEKRINEFFIPHYIIINMFNSFQDLLILLDKTKSKTLNSLNGTTNRLIKLARKEPKKSLEFLFNFYDINKIFSNPALNQLVLRCVDDPDDYNKYIKPVIPLLNHFNYPLKKNVIKACIKLEKYKVSIPLIEEHLTGYDYFNEMGNCMRFNEPKKAIDLYLSALNNTKNEHEILKSYININRIIYENNIQKESIEFIKESIEFIKKNYNFFKKNGSYIFKYLQKYVVLNEIASLDKEEKIKKLRFLFSKFYISKKGKKEILNELDDDIVVEITE